MLVENNQVVSIEYQVKEAGEESVVDSNVGGEPLEFIIGKGQIIKGLEDKLIGMKKDEKADILVNAVDAYGEYSEDALTTAPREQFAGIELEVGMPLYGQSPDGQTVMVTVKDFNEQEVTVDYNHPLAGKNLMFSVTVLNVREPSVDEAMSGQVAKPHDGGGCGCGTGGCGSH
jgi:FKBP-type peptidyl-prolyl cis-trans isomerase SlyD